MNKYSLTFLLLIIFFLTGSWDLSGQSWEFIKEKEGVKLYTKKEVNISVKSFKGEVYLHAPVEKVYSLITNVKNFDNWDEDITEIRVLLNEKDKHIQYYLVYDVAWPVADRDLVVDAIITTDTLTGIITVEGKPLPNVIPENPDLVRIKKYWQKWTIIPKERGIIHLILEGSVDPGGNVPAWLSNMVITDTPLKSIRSIQTHIGAK
jgi:hypothetical protein